MCTVVLVPLPAVKKGRCGVVVSCFTDAVLRSSINYRMEHDWELPGYIRMSQPPMALILLVKDVFKLFPGHMLDDLCGRPSISVGEKLLGRNTLRL